MGLDKRIHVLSVEDHPIFREGLTAIINSQPDMVMTAQAGTASESIAAFRLHQPDVTLMDLRLGNSSGIDALISIRSEFPRARVVILTTSEGDVDIQRAMRAGAAGYLLKTASMDQIFSVVRSVHEGRRYLPPEVAERLTQYLGEEDLTPRELGVLNLIQEGYRNKQIAGELAISETTVNFHIKNLMDKLRANDRTHAVMIAVRRGMLQI